jgi:hypothetical protein
MPGSPSEVRRHMRAVAKRLCARVAAAAESDRIAELMHAASVAARGPPTRRHPRPTLRSVSASANDYRQRP